MARLTLGKRERDTETDPGKEGDRHRARLTLAKRETGTKTYFLAKRLAKRETGTETDPGKEGDRHRDRPWQRGRQAQS